MGAAERIVGLVVLGNQELRLRKPSDRMALLTVPF